MLIFMVFLAVFLIAFTRGVVMLARGKTGGTVSDPIEFFRLPLIGFASHQVLQPVPRFRDYVVRLDKFRRR